MGKAWLLALCGLVSTNRAFAAMPEQAVRLDVAASQSNLSGGLKDWRDRALVVTVRPNENLWLSLGAEQSERFALRDNVARIQIARTLPKGASIAVTATLGPQAVFRAQSLAQVSLGAPQLFGQHGGLTWGAGLDLSAAHYRSGDVQSLQPYLLLASDSGGTGSLRVIETRDAAGSVLQGYAVSTEMPVGNRLRLKLGYVDAPETDTGRTLQVRGTSAALGLEVSDSLTLRFTIAHEQRAAFDRDELGLNLVARF
jgi:YaiO family outer membrane protein